MKRYNSLRNGAKLAAVTAFALAAASIVAQQAYAADSANQGMENAQVTNVRHQQNSSPETEPYLGTAPYICTPSGFGSKARCFYRSSIHQHG
ncbi:MAG TPA: hypothetical protein VLC29_09460 [Rhizomicrobium sp.]|nr:hypothetical protein [Rhizomicrobium sp.]